MWTVVLIFSGLFTTGPFSPMCQGAHDVCNSCMMGHTGHANNREVSVCGGDRMVFTLQWPAGAILCSMPMQNA